MISPLLMAIKQLSEFVKDQIVAYHDYGQSFGNIAKKLNKHHSAMNDFLKNLKKTGNYHLKESCGCKRKTIASEDRKNVWTANRQSFVTSQLKVEINKKCYKKKMLFLWLPQILEKLHWLRHT